MNNCKINTGTLISVLSKMLNTKITHADYQTKDLEGGTIGDVLLVTGVADTADGRKLPYNVVYKKTGKFERHNDPGSWRREYDLYTSDFSTVFTDSLRWPECYYAEINEKEHHLWMEYIDVADRLLDGELHSHAPWTTGLKMTPPMYVHAAEALGRFQGRLYAEQPSILQRLTNLSNTDYLKGFYMKYRLWPEVYDYIRNSDCQLPKELCKMLIEIDEHADDIFLRVEKLPIVLCHRDFWVTNIFCASDKVVLIDWDTTGWGYLGEDIASLIADDADIIHMVENFKNCIPAYYKGFSEYVDVSYITDNCIYEIILLMYGYRTVEGYRFAETSAEKDLCLKTLQKIYELKGV